MILENRNFDSGKTQRIPTINPEKLEIPVIYGYTTQIDSINPGSRLNVEDLKKLEV